MTARATRHTPLSWPLLYPELPSTMTLYKLTAANAYQMNSKQAQTLSLSFSKKVFGCIDEIHYIFKRKTEFRNLKLTVKKEITMNPRIHGLKLRTYLKKTTGSKQNLVCGKSRVSDGHQALRLTFPGPLLKSNTPIPIFMRSVTKCRPIFCSNICF